MPPGVRSVLFVDDETRILDGLRRMLHPCRGDFRMTFVASAREALACMERDTYDIVVADMRMPEMSGAELLREVARRHPHTIRIVLSGQAEKEAVFGTVGPVHQYLTKPCDADLLRATLRRAVELAGLLSEEGLQRLVARMERLPSLPTLYTAIMRALESPDASAREIGGIIERDMAMSARVLQLVNSSFFGLRQKVTSPVQATALLGLDIVKTLALTIHVFSPVEGQTLSALSHNQLWQHSLLVAAYAKRVAKLEGLPPCDQDTAFAAGLLHDIGKLVLAANLPLEYSRAQQQALALERCAAERTLFRSTHAEIGAYLLGLWGLPEPLVESAAFHHNAWWLQAGGFGAPLAVQVADRLAIELDGCGREPTGERTTTMALAAAAGWSQRLDAWRGACEGETSSFLSALEIG